MKNDSSMKRGLLITFEGIDGCGKTTQVQRFLSNLEQAGYDHILVREPGGTPIGEQIRQILLDKNHFEMQAETELLLYSASRFQLCQQIIAPALTAGKIVVCDRFYDSTTAYQGYGRGLDLEFIQRLNRMATRNLVPDMTLVFDISLEERTSRIHHKELDRLETENAGFQAKVRNGFRQIAEAEPERVFLLDGTKAVAELSKTVWQLFLNRKKR